MSGFNHDTKANRDREEMEGQEREVWHARATAVAGVLRTIHGLATVGPLDLATVLRQCAPLAGVLELDQGDESMRWVDPEPRMTLIDHDADLKAQLDDVARARGLRSGADLIADIAASDDPMFSRP